MANPQHLDILKSGVEEWNRWEKENSDTIPDLRGADLKRANLEGAILVNADLDSSDLEGAILVRANLARAKLSRANLVDANLFQAFLGEATLVCAGLRGAELGLAGLGAAELDEANLAGANLERADLSSARLFATGLDGSRLGDARMADTLIGNCDLSGADGLEDIYHLGPSTVGLDTLVKTAQRLGEDRSRQGEVETFFRGAGVDEQFIDLFQSMIGQPIEFYSCFISYSHNDKAFARRLYDSLRGRGIRCWLDEHALVPGDRIIRVVNKAIRVNDKLLLCCSENSLQSTWVEDEIAAAVKKEREEKRDVLIPLNLDGCFREWKGDHSVRVQERLAADFTGWEKDNAKFEREFEKVVKALRPRAEDSAPGKNPTPESKA